MAFLRRLSTRRLYQFSLQSLLLAITAICVWLGIHVDRANRQRAAVAAIVSANGDVIYEHQPSAQWNPDPTLRPPEWLLNLLGNDLLCDVVAVDLSRFGGGGVCGNTTDAALRHDIRHSTVEVTDELLDALDNFPKLQRLSISRSSIRDDDLARFRGMKRLEMLYMTGTPLTDAAVPHLKGLTTLREVDIQRTHLSEGAVDELRKALPHAGIYH